MLNTALTSYIRTCLSQGYDRNNIYSYLLKLGWNANDLQDSFYFVEQEMRARQMQQPQQMVRNIQPQIMQRQRMQQQTQIYQPMATETAPISNFIIPIASIFLILMIGGGVFLFTGFGKATVGAPTGIEKAAMMSPPERIVLNCAPCQYIQNNRCVNYNCCSDAGCNDNNPNTDDICENPYTINSRCISTLMQPQQSSTEDKEEQESTPPSQEPQQPALTCLDQFGIKCLESEACPGEILPATDTGKCCSVMCE